MKNKNDELFEFDMGKYWDETKVIKISTTFIEIVFATTYVVVNPKFMDLEDFIIPEQLFECSEYIEKSKKNIFLDEEREISWVFSWIYLLNPFNNEKVPLWISDYIDWIKIWIPAHNKKDYKFAKKFNLAIKHSIAEIIIWFWDWKNAPIVWKKEVFVDWITAIILDELKEKILVLKYPNNWIGLVTWWVEKWDSFEKTLFKEIEEETWYIDLSIVEILSYNYQEYYHFIKDTNWYWINIVYVISLNSNKKIDISLDEQKKHTPFWYKIEEAIDLITFSNHKRFVKDHLNLDDNKTFIQDGLLVNSWIFDKMSNNEAREKIKDFAIWKWFWRKILN